MHHSASGVFVFSFSSSESVEDTITTMRPDPPSDETQIRRGFPVYGMTEVASADLRLQGIVVIPFMDSVALNPERLRPHLHEFFQIFILQGNAVVMHDFVEFKARGTTMVFMSPGQVHTARPTPGLRGTTVSFTQEFFDGGTPPPSRLLDFDFFFPAEIRPWLSVSVSEERELWPLFRDLQTEFDQRLSGAIDILRATLQILLVRISRLYAKKRSPRKVSRASQLARQFHLSVEQHFREDRSLAEYARELGVTTNHLHDVVREATGQPAGQILRQRRLLDAKRLLSHTDLSVSEVGYQVGFKDPSYFSRFFRQAEDLAPAEFRTRIREKYQPKSA
jgi:AraC family transcriptional regulator, transcriptional activator of pobA